MAENFALNTNSKDLEVSFLRIYPIILPYFISNKIHDSSIYNILLYAESFLLKCSRWSWIFHVLDNTEK